MSVINEPFAVRRRRQINWSALLLPLCFAIGLGVLLYACNEFRRSADRAVERWALKVGME